MGYRIPYPKEVGYASIEELAHVYPSACTYVTAPRLATKRIARNATGNHEARWVRDLLARPAEATVGAVSVAKPECGSDLGRGMSTIFGCPPITWLERRTGASAT
jgi:alkylation response protein AidB-like acyl-CoA dehydrogenase